MKTTVGNWSIVTIDDFQIVWGIVVTDETGRFNTDEFVCTSRVVSFGDNQALTKSGSIYELIGEGVEYTANYKQLMLLRGGKSPDELNLEVK